jgi:hypothetical protein
MGHTTPPVHGCPGVHSPTSQPQPGIKGQPVTSSHHMPLSWLLLDDIATFWHRPVRVCHSVSYRGPDLACTATWQAPHGALATCAAYPWGSSHLAGVTHTGAVTVVITGSTAGAQLGSGAVGKWAPLAACWVRQRMGGGHTHKHTHKNTNTRTHAQHVHMLGMVRRQEGPWHAHTQPPQLPPPAGGVYACMPAPRPATLSNCHRSHSTQGPCSLPSYHYKQYVPTTYAKHWPCTAVSMCC